MTINAYAAQASIPKNKKLSVGLVLLMAVTCGMAVANMYYNQPLLAEIGRSFHTTAKSVGVIAMLTQIGYALGMLLFVPLGDMWERRRILWMLLIAVSISLIGIATAKSLLLLGIASFMVGFTTVVPQLIVPLAATLAAPSERGKVIGTVMSGLLIGILLARTFSGMIGGNFGWRAVFWIAAGLMLLMAVVLRLFLPPSYPETKMTYGRLLASIGQLVVQQRTLREATFIAAMQFGGFSAFWTVLAFFLEGSPYHYGSEVAGLFGLVGVAGAAAAPVAGRLADRFRAGILVGFAIILTLLAYICFWLFGQHLWGLLTGVVLLDLGVQSAQILNQSRVYALIPEARNRLNTIYMVSAFLFGSAGAWLGSYAWSLWQWNGVCAVGGGMVLIGFLVWIMHRLKESNDR